MVQDGKIYNGLCLAMLLTLIVGCHTTESHVQPDSVRHTVPASLHVPPEVQRLAILYRSTPDRDEMEAYNRLEGATFQLKEQRPSLRIFERSQMPAILQEQRFQLGGRVSEDTAVRLGRLLGVDSVLIYDIQGPSLRDRLFAESHEDLPPYLVTSKIIRVESAEVVFHNVVTARVGPAGDHAATGFASEFSARPLTRAALDRGVAQTITDLHHAFR